MPAAARTTPRIPSRPLRPANSPINAAAFLTALAASAMIAASAADAALPPWRTPATPTEAQRTLDSLRKPEREIRAVVPGLLWIDAEDFANYGGWWIDTQFVNVMGSAYLIASGIGDPVDDATTSITLPQPGRYTLWVRARNWFPEHSPGRFKVAINGRATETAFGAAKTASWTWESGGIFELPAGPAKIALQDLTGEYGRCDAIVLAADPGYRPPDDLDALNRERARLTGLSLDTADAGNYDVIVVGAGTAGSCAAIAAARLGTKTLLINDRPVLGGNASIELGVPPQGAGHSHPNAREGGIIEEVFRLNAEHDFPMTSDAFRILAAAETNLTVLLNERVFACDLARPGRIATVKSVNTLDGRIRRARGTQFIDCTGDGWVGFFAGAEYRLGREDRAEFDEDLAPEKADKITMSGCIMGRQALSFRAEDMGEPRPYTPPPWAARIPPDTAVNRKIKSITGGNWWLEHQGEIDDLNDPELARDELIRITFGYWDFIKNVWEGRAQATQFALTAVPIWNAKRETRRLVGDYILKQKDAEEGRVFPDRISYGGWPLDVHHPRGIYSGKEGPYYSDRRVPLYTIPYRCLYSKNVENLLFAGRDMSVTHIALGTVRVQSTLATLGQAAGTAAALCIRHAATPRGIHEKHLAELQQTLLKHDQFIPELRNEDPADLARAAKITASSARTRDEFSRDDVVKDEDAHEFTTARAVMFPTGMDPKIDAVWLLLRNTTRTDIQASLHLRGAAASGEFAAGPDIATAAAAVKPGAERWVKFAMNATVPTPFFYAWLPRTPGLEWRLMKSAPLGACRGYGGEGSRPWSVNKGQFYAAATEPPRASPAHYAPENITDGVSRIVGDAMHMWASDPKKPMPQWIELDLGKPTAFNTVYITFDTDMNPRWPAKPLARQCVRDYEVACDEGPGWRALAADKANFQRHRVHRFDAVTARRVRVNILATNGDPSARVFEVRVYKE